MIDAKLFQFPNYKCITQIDGFDVYCLDEFYVKASTLAIFPTVEDILPNDYVKISFIKETDFDNSILKFPIITKIEKF